MTFDGRRLSMKGYLQLKTTFNGRRSLMAVNGKQLAKRWWRIRVLVSRLKVPRFSVLSQSRTKFWKLSRLDENVFRQSHLVCFNFTQSRLGLVLIWIWSFQKNEANSQLFSSLKDGSHLILVKKDTKSPSPISVSHEILCQVSVLPSLTNVVGLPRMKGLVMHK